MTGYNFTTNFITKIQEIFWLSAQPDSKESDKFPFYSYFCIIMIRLHTPFIWIPLNMHTPLYPSIQRMQSNQIFKKYFIDLVSVAYYISFRLCRSK